MFDRWQFWALLAPVFAAFTAIPAKLGVDQVTPISRHSSAPSSSRWSSPAADRLAGRQPLSSISTRGLVFLTLSGLAGASWLRYFPRAQAGQCGADGPIDKLSMVLVAVLAAALLGEHLSWQAWISVGLIGAGAA